MHLTNELYQELRDNLKPSLPKLLAHGLHSALNELMPIADGTTIPKLNLIITALVSSAIYADLATEAPAHIAKAYFDKNRNGIVVTAGGERTYFVAYTFQISLDFRTYLMNPTI